MGCPDDDRRLRQEIHYLASFNPLDGAWAVRTHWEVFDERLDL